MQIEDQIAPITAPLFIKDHSGQERYCGPRLLVDSSIHDEIYDLKGASEYTKTEEYYNLMKQKFWDYNYDSRIQNTRKLIENLEFAQSNLHGLGFDNLSSTTTSLLFYTQNFTNTPDERIAQLNKLPLILSNELETQKNKIVYQISEITYLINKIYNDQQNVVNNQPPHIVVLDAMNDERIGGGYALGNIALEERLYDTTTLSLQVPSYAIYKRPGGIKYTAHENRAGVAVPKYTTPIASNELLYTKNVRLLTASSNPNIYEQQDVNLWQRDEISLNNLPKFDVIDDAAIDLSDVNLRNRVNNNYEAKHQLAEYMRRKARAQIISAIMNQHYEDGQPNPKRMLLLSLFGCGVFKNDKELVSRCYYEVLFQEGLIKYFDQVHLFGDSNLENAFYGNFRKCIEQHNPEAYNGWHNPANPYYNKSMSELKNYIISGHKEEIKPEISQFKPDPDGGILTFKQEAKEEIKPSIQKIVPDNQPPQPPLIKNNPGAQDHQINMSYQHKNSLPILSMASLFFCTAACVTSKLIDYLKPKTKSGKVLIYITVCSIAILACKYFISDQQNNNTTHNI